jgi:hypothetical protein
MAAKNIRYYRKLHYEAVTKEFDYIEMCYFDRINRIIQDKSMPCEVFYCSSPRRAVSICLKKLKKGAI